MHKWVCGDLATLKRNNHDPYTIYVGILISYLVVKYQLSLLCSRIQTIPLDQVGALYLMYLIPQLKLYEIPFIVLTFKLQVLCSAFRQRVEGVTREVGRWVKYMRLPLLQDVLQQLIQDIPCGDVKVKGELYVSQVTFCARRSALLHSDGKFNKKNWVHTRHCNVNTNPR